MSPSATHLPITARGGQRLWAVVLGWALVRAGWSWLGSLCLALGSLLLGLSPHAVLPRRAALAQRVGKYVLGEKLGEGGMGVVYKGNHALLDTSVAIKLLPQRHASQANIQRFEREVQLTRGLSHPNTIAVYDFGRTREGLPYYVMEYVDGLDLQTLVEREGPLAPARVAHLLAQLAGALRLVHAAGLIHRDVKPANVMLCEQGGAHDVVKMLDFGLTLALDERNSGEPGQIAGTPLYLPPEAITAPETVEARSDLYSLGALGYFLLTGATPFDGRNMVEVCGHHVHSAPLPPSQRLGAALPARLEALILACLAKCPSERPADAAELQAALLPLAASWTPELARSASAQPAAPRPLRARARAWQGSGRDVGFLPTVIAA